MLSYFEESAEVCKWIKTISTIGGASVAISVVGNTLLIIIISYAIRLLFHLLFNLQETIWLTLLNK